MRKHFVIALVCSAVSVAAFIRAGVHFTLNDNPFAFPSLFGLGCIYLSFAIIHAIKDYEQNAKNTILRKFDTQKPYRVLGTWQVDGRYIFRVYDYLAGQIRIAEIESNCPRGFVFAYEDKDNQFLVPDGKKLTFDKDGDFVFVSK